MRDVSSFLFQGMKSKGGRHSAAFASAIRRPVLKAQPGKGGKRGTPRRPLHPDEEEYIPLDLEYSDLLAVCVLSIRPVKREGR